MDQLTLAIIVLLATIAVSRLISELGLRRLSAEQKGRLIERLAPIRTFGLLVFLGVFALAYRRPGILIASVFVYIVAVYALSFWRVRPLSLPHAVIACFAASLAATLAGVGAFFLLLWR